MLDCSPVDAQSAQGRNSCREGAAIENAATKITLLAPAERHKIFLYLGALVCLLAFGDPNGGLMDVSISFMLKNKLHLAAQDMARFRLFVALPLYFAGLFGFLRDRFSPFGMKDRGFLVLFGFFGASLYLIFAFTPLSFTRLLIALPLLTSAFLMLSSALNGLASALGQQHAMSGRISALWNAFAALPGVAAMLAGGWVSDRLEALSLNEATRLLFLGGAAILSAVALFGFLRPKAVFGNLANERPEKTHVRDDLRRLLRHRAIYPALAIWLLWNFAPGAQTPLQYYLQNTLHAPDSVWGEWNAIFAASFLPPFLLYAVICRRVALKNLLLWGTLAAVPQFTPLLLVHDARGALLAAAPMGLMGGVATAAYIDLLIRSCPPGLQGTTLMLSSGLYYVAARFGDVLGTGVYQAFGGFAVCVALITIVYAAILPLILLVPKKLISYADGHVPPA
ncbi:MFS transporter [Rhodoblastus sp.]|uniref:MFS transporter n=3 Tax=Rhodoblastus sp. TaxID=1962975 RepID=UPI003F99A9A3